MITEMLEEFKTKLSILTEDKEGLKIAIKAKLEQTKSLKEKFISASELYYSEYDKYEKLKKQQNDQDWLDYQRGEGRFVKVCIISGLTGLLFSIFVLGAPIGSIILWTTIKMPLLGQISLAIVHLVEFIVERKNTKSSKERITFCSFYDYPTKESDRADYCEKEYRTSKNSLKRLLDEYDGVIIEISELEKWIEWLINPNNIPELGDKLFYEYVRSVNDIQQNLNIAVNDDVKKLRWKIRRKHLNLKI